MSFDREAALRQAMLLFWRHGYEPTSVNDLLRTMGITPPSLYTAFVDKSSSFSKRFSLTCPAQLLRNRSSTKLLHSGRQLSGCCSGGDAGVANSKLAISGLYVRPHSARCSCLANLDPNTFADDVAKGVAGKEANNFIARLLRPNWRTTPHSSLQAPQAKRVNLIS